VIYAQPNHLYRHHDAPDDPRYEDQTALMKVRWSDLWYGLGPARRSVVLAIIDSGVDYTHEDLSGNVWINALEADGDPGVDDDGNGYVDDVRGWDFADAPELPGQGDFLTPDNDPSDESGHGTHIAGIAAAASNNGTGMSGVAPDTRIMVLRAGVTLQSGGTFLEEDDLAAAILYAVDNGADVVNMSWGSDDRAYLITDALRFAADNGCILVASAGNSGALGLAHPAALDETIAVSATDRDDARASFSSTGVPLDLAAPGINILGSQPGNSYGRRSGTSFAAPFVSGFASLVLSRRPELTTEQVRSLLARGTVDLGTPGWDDTFGSGRIDGARLLAALADSLDAPTARIRTPRSGQEGADTLEVSAEASGPTVTGYRVSWGMGRSPATWAPLRDGPPDAHIRFAWDISSLTDTVAVLRLEVDLAGGGTLEDRSLIAARRAPPTVSGIAVTPVLVATDQAYEIAWSTDRPAEGLLLIHSAASAREDTLSTGIVHTKHKVSLPTDLPEGPLHYRILSRGPAGAVSLTPADTLSIVRLTVQTEGFHDVGELPDGFLPDRPADFDGDGHPEVALMPYIEGSPYSPTGFYERQDDGTFAQVAQTAAGILPWAIGDGDNDGRLDLLGSSLLRLRLLVGRVDSPFPRSAALDQFQTWGGEIADLDGDGRNEIIARSGFERGLRIFRTDEGDTFYEAGTFTDPTSGGGDLGPRFVIADLDGDGQKEALVGDGDGDLWTCTMDAGGLLSATWILEGDDDSDARWIGGGADLDGDGVVEFAVARATEDDDDALNGHWEIEIYSTTGPANYALEWSTRISGVTTTGNGLSFGDVDGDGLADLTACLLPDLYVFRSDSPNAYRPIWHSPAALTHRPVIADLDGNGRPELLYNRDGAVRIVERVAPPANVAAPELLSARPLERDRVELLWMAAPGASTYGLLRGSGTDSLAIFVDGLTGTTYLDSGLVEDTTYRYAVAARLGDGSEVRSGTAEARPNAPPEIFRVEPRDGGRLVLTFSEPMAPTDQNGYAVHPGLGRPTSAILDRGHTRVFLTFGNAFLPGVTYTLAAHSVSDTSGTPLLASHRSLSFAVDRTGYPTPRIADFDDDGKVAFSDFSLFAQAFGGLDPAFDLDGNGRVAFSDFVLFARFYGWQA
jgi:subtilisin family serine protease